MHQLHQNFLYFQFKRQVTGLAKLSEIFSVSQQKALPKWRHDYFRDNELPSNLIQMKNLFLSFYLWIHLIDIMNLKTLDQQ